MEKQLFVTTEVTQISGKDLEGKGAVRRDENGNEYKWVYNNNSTNSTAAAYAFAVYATGDRTLAVESEAATLTNAAGIWQAEITGHKYGWVKVKGKGKIILFRTAANSTITYQSIPNMAALVNVSAQDYFVTTNANRYPDEAYIAGSLATLPTVSGNTTNQTVTCNAMFNFRL